MAAEPETLTLHDVAAELGVHYMTAYRYVRLGYLAAHKEGRQWRVAQDELDRFRTAPPPGAEHDAPWAERLLARMLAGDQAGAYAVVEAALASGTTPAEVYTDLIGPSLRHVGERWAAGQLTEGEEHIATAVATRLIGRLGPRFGRRGQVRGTILASTPPGDRHALGVEMLADILRGEGYEVISLGADVPVASLAHAVGQVDDLVAVCVSAFGPTAAEHLPRLVEAVQSVLPVPVIVGGPGVDAECASVAGARHATTADEVVTILEAGPRSG